MQDRRARAQTGREPVPNFRVATHPPWYRQGRQCILTEQKRFIADSWGAAKVTRASSSGPISRIRRRLEARACQTRMVRLPSTRLFPQIRDETIFSACAVGIDGTVARRKTRLSGKAALPGSGASRRRGRRRYRGRGASRLLFRASYRGAWFGIVGGS